MGTQYLEKHIAVKPFKYKCICPGVAMEILKMEISKPLQVKLKLSPWLGTTRRTHLNKFVSGLKLKTTLNQYLKCTRMKELLSQHT